MGRSRYVLRVRKESRDVLGGRSWCTVGRLNSHIAKGDVEVVVFWEFERSGEEMRGTVWKPVLFMYIRIIRGKRVGIERRRGVGEHGLWEYARGGIMIS